MENKNEKIKYQARSLPFWSWNDELESEKLVEQIRWMNQQRFGGFFMHARAGLSTEYLGERWFDAVKTCSAAAKELGMQPWLYDENGWPSGFVGGELLKNKAYREHYLKGNLGAFDEKAAWHYQIVGEELLYIETPCEGECLNVYDCESASTVDVLSGAVTDAFIQNTHERYQEVFGGKLSEHIEGFFTDEPQYCRSGIPYPHEIIDSFIKEYGENPIERLGLLFVKKKGYQAFRYRYWKTCQQLFLKNFAKKIYDWCEANNVKITGHYVEERSLFTQMLFNAGIMPYFEYLHYPGIDWLCRRYMPVFTIRQMTSVAAQLGKKTTLSEMFAMTGWDATPIELKSMADYQYLYGINSMCQHLLPYSEKGERKYDHPAHFSAFNPWVDKGMYAFNRYFDALGAWLQECKEDVNIAVFNTVRSAYLEYEYNDPSSVAALDDSLLPTCEQLANNHVAFHLIDETLLAKYGSADGGKLRLGACEYDVLVVPHILTMDKTTENILRKFVLSGGKVLLCDNKPAYLEGEPFEYGYLNSNITWEEIYQRAGYIVECDGRLDTALYTFGGEKYVFAVNITDKTICTKITCDELPMDGEYNVETGEVSYLGATLELKPKQSKILCRFKGDSSTTKETCVVTVGTDDYQVVRFTDNYLAVDFAQLSYDGVEYGKQLPIMGIFQKLLHERYNGKVYLKSTFEIKEKTSVLKLLAEDVENTNITINGKRVTFEKQYEFKDSFYEADISKAVQVGKNELIACYHFHQADAVYHALFGEGVTESLRNCMRYNVTLEPMYIAGDFGVYAKKVYPAEKEGFFRAEQFYIASAPKNVRNVVTDGLPFFSGCLTLKTTITCKKTCKKENTVLECLGRFHCVEVYVNGNRAGMLLFDDRLDVSAFTHIGENTLELRVYTGNRNMLGPHHMSSLEEEFAVSPYSFDRFGTWEDGESKEFSKDYSFVRFGFFND